jgi:hypothetical protein
MAIAKKGFVQSIMYKTTHRNGTVFKMKLDETDNRAIEKTVYFASMHKLS